MKSVRMFAAVALVVAGAMIGTAGAEDQTSQQGSWVGNMMGGWVHRGMMGPGGMMGLGGMGPGMMDWGQSGQAMCIAMASHIDGRLAFIKAELKITQDQESLWNGYAAAARDNANAMLAHCTAMMSQRGSSKLALPDRLDQHEQLHGRPTRRVAFHEQGTQASLCGSERQPKAGRGSALLGTHGHDVIEACMRARARYFCETGSTKLCSRQRGALRQRFELL